MPDISKCTGQLIYPYGKICPLRESCYRYTARPSEYYQSYFVDAPFIIEPDGVSCEHFWKIESMQTKVARFKRQTK